MNLIFDALLIVICAFILYSSSGRGLLKNIMSLASTVSAFLLATVLTPSLSGLLSDRFILGRLVSGISSTVASHTGGGSSEEIYALLSDIPDSFGELLTRYGVSESGISLMTESAASGSATVTSISETIVSPASESFAATLSFICLFVLSKFALSLMIFVFGKVFEVKPSPQKGRLGGLLIGLITCVPVVFVYSALLGRVIITLGVLSPDLFGKDVLDSTLIIKALYDNNLLPFILKVL